MLERLLKVEAEWRQIADLDDAGAVDSFIRVVRGLFAKRNAIAHAVQVTAVRLDAAPGFQVAGYRRGKLAVQSMTVQQLTDLARAGNNVLVKLTEVEQRYGALRARRSAISKRLRRASGRQ